MKWDVYYYDINRNKISTFNIFDHWSFREYTKKTAKKLKTKEEFAEQIRRELQFYYWSKAEWELVVHIEDNRIFLIPWCGCREPEKVRIDVTDDTNFDWRGFAEKHTARQIYGNEAKIDVFDQIDYRWEEFVDYAWENKKELLRKKNG